MVKFQVVACTFLTQIFLLDTNANKNNCSGKNDHLGFQLGVATMFFDAYRLSIFNMEFIGIGCVFFVVILSEQLRNELISLPPKGCRRLL